jgi:L-fuculose-phosphate aldolase
MGSQPNLVVLRREMARTGRLMYEKNLIVAAEGNLSIRLGGHSFLVTPAGRNKGHLRVQDLVEVDAKGRSALGTATSEWPLHRRIYERRPAVRAICHAHPPWATAFAAAGRDLDGSLLTETAAWLPRVPVAPRAVPGTTGLADSVVPLIDQFDAVLLGHHGVVTVGADLPTAFNLLETVERLAQVTLLAEAASGHSRLDPQVLRKLQEPQG